MLIVLLYLPYSPPHLSSCTSRLTIWHYFSSNLNFYPPLPLLSQHHLPVHLAIFPTSELEEVQFLRKKDPKSTTQITWWPWWPSGGDKLGSRWGPNSDQFLIQIQTQQDLFGGVIFSTAERRAIRPAIAAYSASSPWMVWWFSISRRANFYFQKPIPLATVSIAIPQEKVLFLFFTSSCPLSSHACVHVCSFLFHVVGFLVNSTVVIFINSIYTLVVLL